MIRQETIKRQRDAAPCDWCGVLLDAGAACWVDLENGCICCSLSCVVDLARAEAADHAIEATNRERLSCEHCPAEGGGCCVCRPLDSRRSE